ncbi:MAG: flippase [Candidatus Cloacimonetes bacterium]|nr:flippase [Candidatus Cloacimonadota bacterium]
MTKKRNGDRLLDNIRNTAKHTAVYSIGNMAMKVLGFILLPLYTDKLLVSEFGTLGLLEVTAAFMIAVLGFRIPTAMMRWCANAKDVLEQKRVISTSVFSLLGILGLYSIIAFFMRNSFSQLLFRSDTFTPYLTILFISIAFEILNQIPFELIRFKQKSFLFTFLMLLRFGSTLGLNIYLIVFLNLGVYGIVLSNLISNILITLVTLPFLIKEMNLSFDRVIFLEMFHYSFPLIFSQISTMLLSMSDRYILNHYSTLDQVGLYTLGYKFATVINVFILSSFQMGFLPIAYKMYDKPEAGRFFAKTLTYLVFISMIAGLGISFFSREVIQLMAKNSDYWAAYTVIPIISLALIFKGVQWIFSLGLHYVKKTKYNAYIVLLSAFVNIVLNFLLIPKFGIYGASFTTLFSMILMSVIYHWEAQKHYPVRYEISKLVLQICLGTALFLISLTFFNLPMLPNLLLKLLLLCSYPFILYLLKFYEPVELDRMKGFWKKWKNPLTWAAHLPELFRN